MQTKYLVAKTYTCTFASAAICLLENQPDFDAVYSASSS